MMLSLTYISVVAVIVVVYVTRVQRWKWRRRNKVFIG